MVDVVVDGFHAPVSSGAFVAQAKAGAFNELPVQYNEELILGMGSVSFPLRHLIVCWLRG